MPLDKYHALYRQQNDIKRLISRKELELKTLENRSKAIKTSIGELQFNLITLNKKIEEMSK